MRRRLSTHVTPTYNRQEPPLRPCEIRSFENSLTTALPARPFKEQVSYLTLFATCEQVSANPALSIISPVKDRHGIGEPTE